MNFKIQLRFGQVTRLGRQRVFRGLKIARIDIVTQIDPPVGNTSNLPYNIYGYIRSNRNFYDFLQLDLRL
jgi:hypothetical protein